MPVIVVGTYVGLRMIQYLQWDRVRNLTDIDELVLFEQGGRNRQHSCQRTYQNNLLFELKLGRLIWQRSCFCTVNHPVWLTYEAGLNLNAFYSVLDAKLGSMKSSVDYFVTEQKTVLNKRD